MTLFKMGALVTTGGISKRMEQDLLFRVGVQQAISNHSNGDWGNLSEGDKQANDDAIKAEQEGLPTDSLLSVYYIGGEKIYISTEWNREVTTVMFPYEY